MALTCGVGRLGAQRAHQFELGALGSFTRYDRAFGLEDRVGGGARLGYFFTDVVGAELDVGYQDLSPRTGSASPTLALGGASLILNFGSPRQLFYILGGYSRLDFEKTAPYRFTDDAVHGAIGDRLFLGDRAALRLEVRAIYAPNTGFARALWAGHLVASLGFSLFTGGGVLPDRDPDGAPAKPATSPNPPLGAAGGRTACPPAAHHAGAFGGPLQCPR